MSISNYNIIPPEIKSQILYDLQTPGCVVSKLAKIYKVSTTSIYNLQKVAQAIGTVNEPKIANNFV